MKNLKKRRLERGFTCESLGKLINVQKSAVSKYERGEIQPSKEVLIKIAEVLDCTTDFLLDITDEPRPSGYGLIGERLKGLRKDRGLSQKEFAGRINVAQNTVSNWENENRDIDSRTLLMLSEYFGVSADYLLGNDNLPELSQEQAQETQKEPTPELGSKEWLYQGLVARGTIKEGHDLTDEQLSIALQNLDSLIKILGG